MELYFTLVKFRDNVKFNATEGEEGDDMDDAKRIDKVVAWMHQKDFGPVQVLITA